MTSPSVDSAVHMHWMASSAVNRNNTRCSPANPTNSSMTIPTNACESDLTPPTLVLTNVLVETRG